MMMSKYTRPLVTKDTLRTDFDTLWTEYAEELAVKKKVGKKPSLEKYLHRLQFDVYKLLKIRPLGDEKKHRAEDNLGFMKPVNISSELADFIKVDTKESITRMDITKKICEYIKEKDLQNPKDRREIFPDPALKSLFKLTETEEEPLTYYSMQKKIQSHIFKVPTEKIGMDANINQAVNKETQTTENTGFIADFLISFYRMMRKWWYWR
jgi:chromatin remodeling complex protein RSC6